MRPCNRVIAESRLAQAEVFALYAEIDPLTEEGAGRSAAVSNAVLAGIAASDSICCRSLGMRSSGDHGDALILLRKVPGIGTDAATQLHQLLTVKNKAQYATRNPNVAETKKSMRAMRKLLHIARGLGE